MKKVDRKIVSAPKTELNALIILEHVRKQFHIISDETKKMKPLKRIMHSISAVPSKVKCYFLNLPTKGKNVCIAINSFTKSLFNGGTEKPDYLPFKHIPKGYASTQLVAVKDSSFSINEGEHLALLGSNGAGKTTTVEMIVGLNKPDSGKIKYNLGVSEDKIYEQIGIQFQESSYPIGITVKRMIKFITDAYGSDITTAELNKMINVFGVRPFVNQEARALSGGQRQRLNILLAFLHKPKVVFLDELSTGLDITIRTEIKKFIKEFCEKNKITIVIVSHDISEIEYLCKRVVIMNKGEIVEDALIEDVKKKQNFESFVVKYITH